jgi:carbon monoxide dehydrogenase subunit G
MLAAVSCCLLALIGEVALGVEPKIDVAVEQSGETFVVDATIDVQVSLAAAWDVLTDFDHMASVVGNLTLSKVTSRNGNTWTVWQEGIARYGPLSFSFQSEREMQLEPMRRILARNLSGTLKRMESEAMITPLNQGVQIKYRATIVPNSLLARIFGKSFIRHEVEEQFLEMAKEMTRRHARAETAG